MHACHDCRRTAFDTKKGLNSAYTVSLRHLRTLQQQHRERLPTAVDSQNCTGAVMTSLFQAQRAVNLVKIPDQTGKTFLVTGGNVGIGYEVVKALAAKNAHVFMTARDAERQQG